MGRKLYAEREFPADHPRNQANNVCGDMSTSLIKTVRGRTIMVQHDTTTPRPYTRHNLVSGTNGVFARYPNRIALDSNPLGPDGKFHEWQHDMTRWYEHYEHPLWRSLASDAAASIGTWRHGLRDALAHCLFACEMGGQWIKTVYDAAAWSAVVALSESSIRNRGNAQDFPDFTRKAWKTASPLTVMEHGAEA